MTLELHNLRGARGSRHQTKRKGRGNASGAGTYSGKGSKGQRARSGGRKRIIQRGVKHFVMRIPKVRGFYKPPTGMAIISLQQLATLPAGSVLTVETLKKLKIINSDVVKVIGSAKLLPVLHLKVNIISAGARQAVEAAGGDVEIVTKAVKPKSRK